jgi:uncharacterized surface protein with fasciclin (FAS1) repeats
MKNKMLSQVSAVIVTSVLLLGCASSDKVDETTGTTISETQTMEGDAAEAGRSAEINYNEMFEELGNTRQFDIMALANSNQNLTTFVTLTEKAEITDVLKSKGPFTVFIPTNAAFQHLSKNELDELLAPENKVKLIKVLQAHILPNKVYVTEFRDAQRIKTADNKVINVQVSPDKTVTIGGARIVKPNVEVSNGVVHIVDDVITATAIGG